MLKLLSDKINKLKYIRGFFVHFKIRQLHYAHRNH